MEWYAFSEKHAHAHLVSGEFNPREVWRGLSRFGALGRLVVSLEPVGDWAMNKLSRQGATAIYVAYEAAADAVRLREVVRAVRASPRIQRERWTTHYEFWFDRTMHLQIIGILGHKSPEGTVAPPGPENTSLERRP